MANSFYLFTINHEGLGIELWFNDILLDMDKEGVFKNRKFPNNLYVIDKENTLKAKITLPGQPPKMPDNLDLKICLYEIEQQMLGDETLPEPVAELLFPGTEAPSFPAEIETTFNINSPFPRWQWQDAEVVDNSDPAVIQDCFSVISDLHQALSAKDFTTVSNMLSLKTQEMANAYYIPIDERIADQENFFNEIFSDSQFEMEAFNNGNLTIIPMAQNRLFLVQQNDGNAAIESKELSEGYCFTLPIYVSKIDGVWKIVR